MKSGPFWWVLRLAIRRFLLRDRIVMATAGATPPGPPLVKGGKVYALIGEKRAAPDGSIVRGIVGASALDPTWPPLLKGGKVYALIGKKRAARDGSIVRELWGHPHSTPPGPPF